MEKKKEESALSVLMRYAGGHKYCTYFSWVFSGLSAIAALLTYVFLYRIIKEVIEAAPNFKEATHGLRCLLQQFPCCFILQH